MKLDEKRILLVEDEPIIGFALEDMIAQQGATTHLVSSTSEAIAALDAGSFDAAIVDVNLNGELSYPLAERLADLGCPFIFATGYGTVTHPPRFADTPTVAKPYDVQALLDALDAAIATNGR